MNQKNYDNKAALAKKRKRRRTILHSTVGILIISTVLVVLSVVFCRVAKFTVTGESPYSREEIVNSVKACEGKSMFLIKTEKLEDLVESALPYTDNITISKQYPRGLRIEVSTAKKAFSVELSKNYYAVTNGRLKVLDATDKLPEDTVTVKGRPISSYSAGQILSFTGKPGDDAIRDALIEIAQAIEDTALEDINMINIGDENNIYLVYDNRIIVKIGKAENLANKLSLAKKSLDEENKLSPAQYGELDVTINKKAVFAPDDLKDLPELVEFLEEQDRSENAEEEIETDEAGVQTAADTVIQPDNTVPSQSDSADIIG